MKPNRSTRAGHALVESHRHLADSVSMWGTRPNTGYPIGCRRCVSAGVSRAFTRDPFILSRNSIYRSTRNFPPAGVYCGIREVQPTVKASQQRPGVVLVLPASQEPVQPITQGAT